MHLFYSSLLPRGGTLIVNLFYYAWVSGSQDLFFISNMRTRARSYPSSVLWLKTGRFRGRESVTDVRFNYEWVRRDYFVRLSYSFTDKPFFSNWKHTGHYENKQANKQTNKQFLERAHLFLTFNEKIIQTFGGATVIFTLALFTTYSTPVTVLKKHLTSLPEKGLIEINI